MMPMVATNIPIKNAKYFFVKGLSVKKLVIRIMKVIIVNAHNIV